MSRARRLSEIAKANQPVFSSTNGTQWWLADPSSKSDPQPALPMEEPEPQPVAARHAAVALQDSKTESPAVQSSTEAVVLFEPPELKTASIHFPPPELQTPSNHFPQAEPQGPSNGAIPTESEPAPRDLATRLGSLRDRFLSLGRRNRGAEAE
jgi:hypothetical protein